MKLIALILLFLSVCCAGMAGLACVVFFNPDAHGSPIFSLVFFVLTVLFSQAGLSLWDGGSDSAAKVYRTTVAGPFMGLAFSLTSVNIRPATYVAAIGVGSILYAAIAIAIGRGAARRYGSKALAS